jgi:hypothetical protein
MVRKTKVAGGGLVSLLLLACGGCFGGNLEDYHRRVPTTDAPMVLGRIGPLLAAVKWRLYRPHAQRFSIDLLLAATDDRKHRVVLVEVALASGDRKLPNETPPGESLKVSREANEATLTFTVPDLRPESLYLHVRCEIDGGRFESIFDLANCFKADP